MAYNVTGTGGSDTLNQSADTGPGTIVGLAGDDCIFTGTGLATVTGDAGNDTVVLQAGNTGTVDGGTENDSIFAVGNTGSMSLFGRSGADTINTGASTSPQTIISGDDSSDGADSVVAGNPTNLDLDPDNFISTNGGDDTIHAGSGHDTMMGGSGNDCIFTNLPPGEFGIGSSNLVFGDEGNDTILVDVGSDTIFAGTGDDSVIGHYRNEFGLIRGNEGADTINVSGIGGSIVGGQDSSDAADSIVASNASSFVLGNGGADTIVAMSGTETMVGGFGNDSILTDLGNDIIFGNENNDTIVAGDGRNLVFGGLGNDTYVGGSGRDSIQGNEDNDTIRALGGFDTIAGGSGADVFAYSAGGDDGDDAGANGPVELLTDVSFNEDRFQAPVAVVFAADVGEQGGGGDLTQAASDALTASATLSGNAANITAAEFTFRGRTFLAINQSGAGFQDASDLLLDITGATGTIDATDFIT